MTKTTQPINWQAQEHIEHTRNASWYVGLAIFCLSFSALAVFLSWWTFLALIILSTISILISALRPPRTIDYTLDSTGLTEGTVHHAFQDYRAFGILKENSHYSAILIPKKRLSLSTKVYFPESSGEAIVDTLGTHLPMEEVKLDFLDKLTNFLRI